MDQRKDSKGRTLQKGEGQHADGRYVFTYRDSSKKQKKAYAWRLLPSDRTPKGKKFGPSLREKELDIRKTIMCSTSKEAATTVYELCEQYIRIKAPSVRHNTAVNYASVLKIIKGKTFGQMKIVDITRAKAKTFLVQMQTEDRRSYSSLQSIRGVLRPAFEQAVEDELIRYNPFDFELKGVIRNDMAKRDALTAEEVKLFLTYVRKHKYYSKYYDLFYLQFHTGLRVSELCGLTVSDIHFNEKYLTVEKQLQRKRTMELYLTPPKTKAGIRKVPITQEVEECLKTIMQKRKNRISETEEPIVCSDDGMLSASGFLFLDKNRTPMVAQTVEGHYRAAAAAFRKDNPEATKKPISSHVARHTFCSLRVKEGMNPATLQRIMGHASIQTTLGWYVHLTDKDVIEEAIKLMDRDEEMMKYEG